jgi:uncharacterized protein (DUF302 family)
METITQYSIDFSIKGEFANTLNRVKEALKAEGFGTLSEIDVQSTLKEKIGKEIAPYTILGVCNPILASEAIESEPKIGVFLPCTVLVRAEGETIQVSAQDPVLMSSVISNPNLEHLAADARQRIVRALASITS